jgi:hypothetical protein
VVVTTLRGACRQRLNAGAHAPTTTGEITDDAPAIRTLWEGGPVRSADGGGGFRKTLQILRKGIFEKPSGFSKSPYAAATPSRISQSLRTSRGRSSFLP